jgi:hypothetical protein
MRVGFALAMAAFVAAAGGCSSTTSTDTGCRTGAECASGVCLASGVCQAAPASDGGLEPGDSATPIVTGDSGVCVTNGDGRIDRAEWAAAPGLRATYAYASNVSVDFTGVTANGVTSWDFRGPYASDTTRAVDVQATTGKWWAGSFTGASYALSIGASSDLLGVFVLSDSGLALRGVVSPADGATKTLLSYDPGAQFLRFPMRKGDSWTTTSTITGTASGIAIAATSGTQYTETYATSVDAEGFVETPFGRFKVLRVLTSLTRRNQFDSAIATLPDRKTVAFVAECFGTVVSATSNGNETNALFTTASELQRIAP